MSLGFALSGVGSRDRGCPTTVKYIIGLHCILRTPRPWQQHPSGARCLPRSQASTRTRRCRYVPPVLLLYWDLDLSSMAELQPTFLRDVVVAGRPCAQQHQRYHHHHQQHQHQQHQHQHAEWLQGILSDDEAQQQAQEALWQGLAAAPGVRRPGSTGPRPAAQPSCQGLFAVDLGGLTSAVQIRGTSTNVFFKVRRV